MNFIKTKDGELSQKLIGFGFTVIDYSDGVWTFLNDVKQMNFSTADKRHMVFTDVLNV